MVYSEGYPIQEADDWFEKVFQYLTRLTFVKKLEGLLGGKESKNTTTSCSSRTMNES
jgi:hypothetical protein